MLRPEVEFAEFNSNDPPPRDARDPPRRRDGGGDDSHRSAERADRVPRRAGSPDLILVDSPDHRFAGAEKSEQRRTNLVLVETSGRPCTARVALADAAGAPLGSRDYALAARQYLQVNDLFGPAGVDLGDGPFQDAAVSASVSEGACQLVGLATVIDNQANSPQIYLLKTAGPEGSTIGF